MIDLQQLDIDMARYRAMPDGVSEKANAKEALTQTGHTLRAEVDAMYDELWADNATKIEEWLQLLKRYEKRRDALSALRKTLYPLWDGEVSKRKEA